METRSAKRKKLLNAAKERPRTDTEDRISDLPDDILHHVFFFLPIKSIARTSVLSKRWKNLWYSFPDLDFTTVNTLSNDSIVMSSTVRKRARSYVLKGAEFVDQILSLLDKHSDIRVLRFRAFLSFSRLVGLIRHAVKHNVQELDVEVSTSDYFNFPRSVINSATLRALRLKSWHPGFRLPPLEIMKAGFRSLSLLSLSRAILHDQPTLVNLFTDSSFPLLKKLHLDACYGLKHLRVECPALEDLSLENCFQLEHLEINVQKLERLKVSGCFDAYSIRTRLMIEAPTLQIMSWSYNAVTEECILQNLTSLHEVVVGFLLLQEDLSSAKVQSVSNFLTGISCCHSLTLESPCIEQWNKDLWQPPSSGEERYWESQTQSLKPFLYHLKVPVGSLCLSSMVAAVNKQKRTEQKKKELTVGGSLPPYDTMSNCVKNSFALGHYNFGKDHEKMNICREFERHCSKGNLNLKSIETGFYYKIVLTALSLGKFLPGPNLMKPEPITWQVQYTCHVIGVQFRKNDQSLAL
ncbi:UNVERIFIED_CONTAM: putative F-box/FBD/LRR-repeat protein [Sesamum calycinum]|uniref:F-box/FBD/LRR-repeat protein n=1 Tax=Sesamum calycinum TaxID=2727403 RepID=A0AAW2MCV6_9LAMI